MSEITELASAQLNGADSIVIELVEANETPAVVIIRWPAKATVLHPRRFTAAADTAARVFAAAVVKLAQIRRERRLSPSRTKISRLIHRCLPSAPHTRPSHSWRSFPHSFTHQSSWPAFVQVAASTRIGGSTARRSASARCCTSSSLRSISD